MVTLPATVNRLKRAAFLLFLSILALASTTAQAQSLTIGTVQACAAGEVLAPVIGGNLVNIGSFTLFITFDSTSLVYKSIENIDPQLNEINYALNTNPFQVAVVWSGVIPANFNQKKLFDLHFTFTGTASPVTFKPNCEVANINLVILPVTYVNGSVSSGLPEITLQPNDTAVKPWGTADFKTNATNVTSFNWKESRDNGLTWSGLADNDIYKGSLTSHLLVQQVPPSYNRFRYSCTLNASVCPVSTQGAILGVDSIAAVPGQAVTSDLTVQIIPNPVNDFAYIKYTLSEQGTVSIEVMNLTGKSVAGFLMENQGKGSHSIRFDASGLPPGLYFCRLLVNNGPSGHSGACRKIIKMNN